MGNWKKYYQPPFRYDGYNYAWSDNNTMSLMFACEDDVSKKIVDSLNGETDFKIDGLTKDGPDFFQYENYIFCVRGWGYLTGIGAMNLPEEEAEKIQDSFIEFVYKTLINQ